MSTIRVVIFSVSSKDGCTLNIMYSFVHLLLLKISLYTCPFFYFISLHCLSLTLDKIHSTGRFRRDSYVNHIFIYSSCDFSYLLGLFWVLIYLYMMYSSTHKFEPLLQSLRNHRKSFRLLPYRCGVFLLGFYISTLVFL